MTEDQAATLLAEIEELEPEAKKARLIAAIRVAGTSHRVSPY